MRIRERISTTTISPRSEHESKTHARADSYEKHPKVQNQGGDFLHWEIPGTGHKLAFFSSGMGDGIYSGYWGLNEQGEAVSLVVPFMNPEYF